MARLTYVWVRWQALLDEVASVPLESEVARFLLAGIQSRAIWTRVVSSLVSGATLPSTSEVAEWRWPLRWRRLLNSQTRLACVQAAI